MNNYLESAKIKRENIKNSNKKIDDEIDSGNTKFYFTTKELEVILNDGLIGKNLEGLPNRTRSKVIKQEICKVLGYDIPESFPRTQPRFYGQNFDVYGQKSNNLQIWNEEISPSRRYVLVGINDKNIIKKVKVLSGTQIAEYDTTGTLTSKYQAILRVGEDSKSKLISNYDTENLYDVVSNYVEIDQKNNPKDFPEEDKLMSIKTIYEKLQDLIGEEFNDFGRDQERKRGEKLQKMVCKALGYHSYGDAGNLPDIRHQLLEVKLQTSPTIDLGAFSPNSKEKIDITMNGEPILVKDIRYAVFNADIEDEMVKIKHLFLTTGEDFFKVFDKMEGNSVNTKIQMSLPRDLFE